MVASLEEDLAVANTLDDPSHAPSEPVHRTRLEVANEAAGLLRHHFSDHPIFELELAESQKILYDCVWKCMKKVPSPEQCLAIFNWICTDPANEAKREKLGTTERLGGYILSCFHGWIRAFTAADEVNHPEYELLLTNLCEGADNVAFKGDNTRFLQPFRAWIESRLGDDLISIEVHHEEGNSCLMIEVADSFVVHRIGEPLEILEIATHENKFST
jgi:hypothetical protein